MNDPNWKLRELPGFALESPDFVDGGPLPQWARAASAGGADRSPALRWSGAPEATRSFALTVYDPDAPTGSGWWHWMLANLPADLTELPQGAGTPGSEALPEGVLVMPSESGILGYEGAAPPPGHGPHRYFFTVTALDVERIDVTPDQRPGYFGFPLFLHGIARAQIVATSETLG